MLYCWQVVIARTSRTAQIVYAGATHRYRGMITRPLYHSTVKKKFVKLFVYLEYDNRKIGKVLKDMLEFFKQLAELLKQALEYLEVDQGYAPDRKSVV